MGFLIRSAFWLSLVLLLIPFGHGSGESGATVGPLQAMNAAREAIGDVSGLCERKPDVCETAGAAFQTIGVRAREGAKVAYDVLDERFGEPDASVQTGSVVAMPAGPAEELAQN